MLWYIRGASEEPTPACNPDKCLIPLPAASYGWHWSMQRRYFLLPSAFQQELVKGMILHLGRRKEKHKEYFAEDQYKVHVCARFLKNPNPYCGVSPMHFGWQALQFSRLFHLTALINYIHLSADSANRVQMFSLHLGLISGSSSRQKVSRTRFHNHLLLEINHPPQQPVSLSKNTSPELTV